MSHKDLPEVYTDYATIQLADKRWYPLEVTRLYTSYYQDGFLTASFIPSLDGAVGKAVSCTHRKEALLYCQQQAAREQQRERERWEEKAIASNVYPERCSHYQDLIQKITGRFASVNHYSDEVRVYASGYHCSYCRCYHEPVESRALVIEDALEVCANAVYADQCQREYQWLTEELLLPSTSAVCSVEIQSF